MFLTNTLCAQSKYLMVRIESVISGHWITWIRARKDPEVEIFRFDPYLQMECLYKETKRLRKFELAKRRQIAAGIDVPKDLIIRKIERRSY